MGKLSDDVLPSIKNILYQILHARAAKKNPLSDSQIFILNVIKQLPLHTLPLYVVNNFMETDSLPQRLDYFSIHCNTNTWRKKKKKKISESWQNRQPSQKSERAAGARYILLNGSSRIRGLENIVEQRKIKRGKSWRKKKKNFVLSSIITAPPAVSDSLDEKLARVYVHTYTHTHTRRGNN